jgi:hypothetical protein
MSEENAADRLTSEAQVRVVAQDVVRALSIACFAAAGTIAVLMVAVWVDSARGYAEADFPGRFLFALLPVLCAAVTLDLLSEKVALGQMPGR